MIYEPSEDSFLLADIVKKYSRDKSVLDMGTGSGIQAKTAISAGAKSVLASDINEKAIEHVKLNYQDIQTIHSNLFDNISGKFDLIIFNPPYLPADKREDIESQEVTTGGNKGDEIIIEFLKQAKEHLSNEGIILIVLSSLTPHASIQELVSKEYYSMILEKKEAYFMEILEVWKIMGL